MVGFLIGVLTGAGIVAFKEEIRILVSKTYNKIEKELESEVKKGDQKNEN